MPIHSRGDKVKTFDAYFLASVQDQYNINLNKI